MRVSYSGARRPKHHAPEADHALFARIEADVIADVQALPPGTIVVHGDEPTGVDALARDTARERGLQDEAHPPDVKAHGGDFGKAARARNVYVTTVRDDGDDGEARFYAAPWSRGTWDAWRKAEHAGVRRCLREYGYDGSVRVTRWPEQERKRVRVKAGNVRAYNGPGKLNITRGSGRGEGLAFAPTQAILDEALASRETARGFFQEVRRLKKKAHVTEQDEDMIATLTAQGWEIEDAAWSVYEPKFIAEMRVSAGLKRGSEKWGTLEEEAWERGVRSSRETWRDLLGGKLGSYDHDGAPLVVLCCFCGPSYVERGHCHAVTTKRLLVALGAEDGGLVR